VRGPFEQPFVLSSRSRGADWSRPAQCIDEVERRFAGDEIPFAEAVVLDNL
jgi:hypothetical protein